MERRTLTLFLALALVVAPPGVAESPAGFVSIVIRDATTGDLAGDEPGLRVIATPVASLGGEASVREAPVNAGRAQLSLATGVWKIKIGGTSGWTPETEVLLDDRHQRREVDIWRWPKAQLQGGLSPASPSLEAVEVVFSSVEGSADPTVPASRVRCPVEARTFHVTVPAARLDIQLRAPGYVPRYHWSVDLRGGQLNLAEWKPVAGASVSGRVEFTEGSSVAAGARIQLLNPQGQPIAESASSPLGPPAFEVQTLANGFFQLGPIPPASYLLAAGKAGYADDSVLIRVVPEAESQLNRPLRLSPPAKLEVALDPPNDPWGEPWGIRLMRGAPGHLTVVARRIAADAAGRALVSSLAPGTYQLLVLGSHDSYWHATEVELTPDSRPVHVSLPLVRIEGRIRVGEAPLAAKLTFGGLRRAPRVTMESTSEGTFTGYLPEREDADWPVYVESQDPPIRRNLQRVRLEVSPGSERARVDIVLPDAFVKGRVVDEAGRPVATGVVVQCQSGEPEEEVGVHAVLQEGDAGQFRFGGLPPGTYQVWAEARDGRLSETVRLTVTDQANVDLMLRGALELEGQVVSSTGAPVPGALVKLSATQAWDRPHEMTTSSADGRFEFQLPPETREVMGSVGATGFGLSMFREQVPQSGPILLSLSPLEGTLEVELGASPELQPGADLVLMAGHAIENLADIVAVWARPLGGGLRDRKLVIPALAVADYSVCNARGVPHVLRPQLPTASIARPSCVSGTLLPGATLELTAPRAP